MKKTYLVSIIGILIIIGAACTQEAPQETDKIIKKVEEAQPIKIGTLGPLTGDSSIVGEPIKHAVNMAIEEINSQGGINGRPIQIISEDAKCNGKDAASAAQKLINIDNVKLIIGGACSGETLAAAPIAEEHSVIMISPASTAPSITNAGDYIFRNMPSDAQGGTQMALEVIKKYKNVAIVSEQTDFSQGQKTIFNHEFQKLGGSIMVDEDFAKEAKDFRTILLKIKVAGPDAIIINAQSAATGGTFIKQLSELNLTYPLYGTMPLASQDALIIAGPAAEGMVIITTPDLNKNNKQTTDFLTRYRKIYGDPSYEIVVAAAYDNVYLLKEAIEAVGLDTDKIRDYLYDLRDYHGLIGTYGFDKNGDVENIKFVAKYVKNGEVVSTK